MQFFFKRFKVEMLPMERIGKNLLHYFEYYNLGVAKENLGS